MTTAWSSQRRRSRATSRNGRGCWPTRGAGHHCPTIQRNRRQRRRVTRSQRDRPKVTDVGTSVTRAEFGAFFYNVIDERSGERVHALHAVRRPREKFEGFPQPRSTAVFGPTFHGQGIVRSGRHHADPRYRTQSAVSRDARWPCAGPQLPGRAGTAASGEVLGGLFFGHSRPGVLHRTARTAADGTPPGPPSPWRTPGSTVRHAKRIGSRTNSWRACRTNCERR